MNLVLPAAHLVGYFEPGEEEWVEARRRRVGGSEIAAILGLSPWESAFSLWHRKAGNIGQQPETDVMRAGKLFEPVLLQEFRRRHPEWSVLHAPGTFVNNERDYQIASPDGAAAGVWNDKGGVWKLDASVGVEIKFVRDTLEWGEAGTDQIPPYYLAQCRWYMDTVGLDEWRLFAYHTQAGEFREYVIRPDASDTELMRSAAVDFLASLEKETPPPLDDAEATYQAVRELHPDIDPVDVEIRPTLAKRYAAAVARDQKAVANRRRVNSQLLDEMGRARRAVVDGKAIAYRIPGRNGNPPFLKPAKDLTA